uniref:Uncharacterized protein n=1 Tax=Ganoderma sp. TQC-2021a TaxID=2816325 RepID=A0A8A5RI58_9APHY|nr:hypothetical protein [Ganoderma sp. TQC-2021a]
MEIKFIMQLNYFLVLPLFIPSLIIRIIFNPSIVRCDPSVISFAALHQSKKSFCFIPIRGYNSKKGITFSIRSENLTITKVTDGNWVCFSILPEPKYLIINSINLVSLSCCGILNLNWTAYPVLVFELYIFISKVPSPFTNPVIHWGSGILSVFTLGLLTGTMLLKFDFTIWERPVFIEAFILIIWFNPSIVRWSLLFIRYTMVLNSKKSAAFWVNKVYFKKCGIIVFVKSLTLDTE